jgi:hypothetical protein
MIQSMALMFPSPAAVATGLYVLVEATGAVPVIDVATSCRAMEKAVTAIITGPIGATFENCMKREDDARKTLIRDWSTYPAPDRGRCVNPAHYMPSYVEWLTCLENAKAVREIQKKP